VGRKRKQSGGQSHLKSILEIIWIKAKKFKIVKNFIKNLKDLTYYRPRYMLKEFHYELIADKTHFYQN
jgi:hypothetical protein